MIVEFAAAPLCPAGHLPLKGGDRLVASFRPSLASRLKLCQSAQLISLLVEEMPGRAEGGNPAHPIHPSSTRFGLSSLGNTTP